MNFFGYYPIHLSDGFVSFSTKFVFLFELTQLWQFDLLIFLWHRFSRNGSIILFERAYSCVRSSCIKILVMETLFEDSDQYRFCQAFSVTIHR